MLIVAASSVVFKDTASTLNKFGFVVVILASTRYSMLSVSERNKSREVKALIEPPEIGIGKSPLLPK